ncbi:2-pyrone-4,6-dicarboxylate hydrolase [Caldovatus sediminis]|uniref:2-pyrone-4,6-dicarboxylate hydrolase n=1 Tax=Caldovatus sediminis TaxID=2041189 RepID=A0A8J2Z8A4_9PROT|nr:amidohydrolase family protein [Caldovatus sediminis]GGG17906.1 2-pyrone-4,6-dicarboxylate hydrolase [Caldovatus sediminis]
MRPCLPPLRAVPRPSWRGPAGSCDCHFHIFGPFDRYPLSPGRGYTPAECLIPAYRRVAEALGIERMVVVQPSIYGTDNACTLDATEEFGLDHARAVVVIDEATDPAALAAMARRGACGVRFNAVSGNGTPLDQLDALARRIAPLGWHLQLYTHGDTLAELAPRLAALPVPVVVDHMGGVRAADGLNGRGFQALLRLLDGGRAWVKLCGYRISSDGPPYADVAPFARALLAAAPERCVWGTDWPHPSLDRHMPDDGALFDLLGGWAPDTATRRRVLVDNPAALYGFPPLSAAG